MWGLENETPYAAERTWVRDKTGRHHWVVAVKGTYDIAPDGALTLAEEQLPPTMAPEYFEGDGESSLRFESDLVLGKATTEVFANAQAYAPNGQPARSVPVQLKVGPIEKTLVVHGPRVYFNGARGLAMSAAEPFDKHPIRYEDAYGGSDFADPDPRKQRMDMRNPIGKGVKARAADLLHTPAHRIEYPQGQPSKMPPAGFGAIPSYWSPRAEFAGTYDAAWVEHTKPLLPRDYDERFTLSAPLDQRAPAYLQGGEPVHLVNLTPEGVLRTTVPKVDLVLTTRVNGRRETRAGTLVTIVLEPDDRRLMAVWHMSLLIPMTEIDFLVQTIIEERAPT